MKFSSNTNLYIEQYEKDIPIIHGENFYLDDEGVVNTININSVSFMSSDNIDYKPDVLRSLTENILLIDRKLAYKTTKGIFVTNTEFSYTDYTSSIQGIVGYDERTPTYSFINNTCLINPEESYPGRKTSEGKLEIQIAGAIWTTPIGEFRCYINTNTFFNITENTVLPDFIPNTFTINTVLPTNHNLNLASDVILNMFIQGNTLYCVTQAQVIGSTPFVWDDLNTENSTVIYSNDLRLLQSELVGSPYGNMFVALNKNTHTLILVDGSELNILSSYEHSRLIYECLCVSYNTYVIIDDTGLSIVGFSSYLNTWSFKVVPLISYNQLVRTELLDNKTQVTAFYNKNLCSILIDIPNITRLLIKLNKKETTLLSACHLFNDYNVSISNYSSYLSYGNDKYELNLNYFDGEYDEETKYLSCIYIGSDLESDNGGDTVRDTIIDFEGKIQLDDYEEGLIKTAGFEESSGDTGKSEDMPVRFEGNKPENWWYLYSKKLRLPLCYTEWTRIRMFPTTKIYNISLFKVS